MTTIAAKHAAAALRNVLKVEFPGVKFYVRSDSCSISVGWTDGPDRDAVQEFCYPFKGSNWDGFNSEYVPTGFTLTVTIDGEEVTGSPLVDHLSLSRTFSPEVTAEAEALWSAQFDGADPKTSGGMRGSFRVEGQWIDDNWAAQQVHQIAHEVVAPRRWAEFKAAPAPARAPRKPRKTAAAAVEPAAARPARKERKERKPRPSGHTITVSYLPEVGLTVTGTRMRDGAGPVLRGLGFTWEGAPAKRWELHTPDASQAPAVTAALTAAGLTVAGPAPALARLTAPEPARSRTAPRTAAAEDAVIQDVREYIQDAPGVGVHTVAAATAAVGAKVQAGRIARDRYTNALPAITAAVTAKAVRDMRGQGLTHEQIRMRLERKRSEAQHSGDHGRVTVAEAMLAAHAGIVADEDAAATKALPAPEPAPRCHRCNGPADTRCRICNTPVCGTCLTDHHHEGYGTPVTA